jgi:AraC-like DNA-binding protein
MQTEYPPLLERDSTPDRVTIDITVPYADVRRAQILHSEWQRQAGDGAMPVPALTLPRRTDGSFRIRMQMTKMADLLMQDMYSEEVAGHCRWDDQVIAAFQLRGESRVAVDRQMNSVGVGLICATQSQSVWDWEVGSGTRLAVFALPAGEIRFPKNQRSITAEQNSAAARMLLTHLRSWADVNDNLSATASWAARNAAVELFHGLLNDQVIDDAQFSETLARAAMEWIDSRLLDRDLDPRAVANFLFVSTRTLHRAFASQATSVMGYVRERRLDRARWQLMSTSLTVSEVAARWHFTDGSHFIKAYKKRFGELPSALPRSTVTPARLSG